MNIDQKKDTFKALQNSILEAKLAYTLWKVISYSRSSEIVTLELAEKYVEAQKIAASFFMTSERSALISFVILVLHPIDQDSRSISLFNIDKNKTDKFIEKNKDIIDNIKLVRNKVFAHKDRESFLEESKILLPSIQKTDEFFKDLTNFYNELASEHIDSVTIFDSICDDLIHEMDSMFMILVRGEKVKKGEIDIEWMWNKNNKKISDVFDSKNKI